MCSRKVYGHRERWMNIESPVMGGHGGTINSRAPLLVPKADRPRALNRSQLA